MCLPASEAASVLPPEDTTTCGIPINPEPAAAVEVVPSAGNDVVLIEEDPIVIPVTVDTNILAVVAVVELIIGVLFNEILLFN